MKFKLFKKYTIFLTVIILLTPVFVFAADPGITVNPNIKCGEIERDDEGKIIETPPCLTAPGISEGETSDFTDLLQWLLSFMLYAAGILAVFMLVVGGVQYVLAGSMGNPEKIGDAQSRLLSALGGLILALGAWIILNTINPKLLNIDVNLQKIPNTTVPGGGNTTIQGGGNTTTNGNGINASQYQWKILEINKSCSNVFGNDWGNVTEDNCLNPKPSNATACCGKR